MSHDGKNEGIVMPEGESNYLNSLKHNGTTTASSALDAHGTTRTSPFGTTTACSGLDAYGTTRTSPIGTTTASSGLDAHGTTRTSPISTMTASTGLDAHGTTRTLPINTTTTSCGFDAHGTTRDAHIEVPLRQSARLTKPTERMEGYLDEEARKRETRLLNSFDKWRSVVKDCRRTLKSNCNESILGDMIDSISQLRDVVNDQYEHLRYCGAPSRDIVRKVDACAAISSDLIRIIHERICGIDDIDLTDLRALKGNQYANSVFSSLGTAPRNPSDNSGSEVTTKLMDAAADLAKKAELQSIEIEAKIKAEQRRVTEHHERELQRVQAQKSVAIAEAKLQAYTDVISRSIEDPIRPTVTDVINRSTLDNKAQLPSLSSLISNPPCVSFDTLGPQPLHNIPVSDSLTHSSTVYRQPLPAVNIHNPISPMVGLTQQDEAVNNVKYNYNFEGISDNLPDKLAKAFADSINLNRIPVPEPPVFSGDPLRYNEWKTAFHSLIEKKSIQEEEKIFYLKRYVAGEAYAAIDGFFYGGSTSAYENAKRVLDERYGHPFVVQRSFRKKLDSWPKISDKDPKALREFADFLKACLDATCKIPSLSILNDCTENQKLISKLPNWATMRWNRQVQETLDSGRDYPPFALFVEFILKEARIACNPISSLGALNNLQGIQRQQRDQRAVPGRIKVLAASTVNNSNLTGDHQRTKFCEYCEKDGHWICKCHRFHSLSLVQKRSIVKQKKLCFGCLRKGHLNKDCKGKHTCGVCKGKHPTCLHEATSPTVQNEARQPVSIATSQTTVTRTANVSQGTRQGSSMIVPVWVSAEDNPSCEILTYALLDTQSDTTFVLDEMCEVLKLVRQDVRLSLSTMTSMHTLINCSRVTNIRVRGFSSSEVVTIDTAYSRDFIPADRSHIPVNETAKAFRHLLPIVDKLQPLQSCEVGLLIGYNCPEALAPRKTIVGPVNQPYAVETVLGWSIVGYSHDPSVDMNVVGSTSNQTSVKELPPCLPRDLIKVLEKDFAHDKPQDIKYSQEDILFLNYMKEGIYQQEDKHMNMPLPFKERPVLPNNRSSALVRLEHLKRKFVRDMKYKDDYVKFMNDVIERKFAEPVGDNAEEGSVWYIPHHGVYHSKKPDKLRVVFDCSARYAGTCLNEHLLTGPDLTNGLTGVLCRFRQYPVAIMCDVEKMFHQFLVKDSDRDFLRFLWWVNGNVDTKPLEYRMRVHLFGAASSPGCANYGFKYLARTQQENLPLASHFIQHDFYVDDGLTSVQTEQYAIKLVCDAQQLCANGGLRLHKFISNSLNVIRSIPPSERASDIGDQNLSLDKLPTEQALGIKWCVKEDAFKFSNDLKDTSPTRRNMLSVVASLFDPLGFLSPFILTGKRILQEMCQAGVGWNDLLPSDKRPAWNDWIKDIANLHLVRITRCLAPPHFMNSTIELHHFSDASSKGYGQCSYIRLVNEDEVHCTLLIGKARVAPLKVVTIPRLELTAAVLSVKVSMFLKSELSLTIDKEYFWTDSRVVLGYINNDARRFHVFVANRVQMIRDVTEPSQWFYVVSKSNPADLASRGLCAKEITESTWLRGPDFLWQREIKPEIVDTDLLLGDLEIKQSRSMCAETTELPDILSLISRFSNWNRAVSIIARLQRLANGIKGTHPTSLSERQHAETAILKNLQQSVFPEAHGKHGPANIVPKTSKLYPLDPIISRGLLCVGGRLRKVQSTSSSFIHPVILPRDSHITQLILAHAHERTCHQGRGITLNQLRGMGYWILGGSKIVASFIRRCVVCRKLRRPTEIQRMADLPEDRVESTPPFTYCGMDCFGPFITKQGRKEMKRYGLLLTCMCSRAIHIEMLDDMSTDSFINGLRCFIAIRGAVSQIRCDQGSNFIGAKNEFQKGIDSSKVTAYLTQNHCEFVFNAPSASHTGGVWEDK